MKISYRRADFSRCRGDNRELLDAAIEDGRIEVLLETEVDEIAPDKVLLRGKEDETIVLPNDAVIVQIGGTPPGKILGAFEVEVVTKYGER